MTDKDIARVTEKTAKYKTEIQHMMFVSGETGDPPTEVTTIIEQIVQGQVIEMLRRATELAHRSGLRSIGIEHLIFLIRHDKPKVSRLLSFLAWKEVRKNVKDNDDKQGGGGADDFAAEDLGPAGPAGPDAGGANASKARNSNKKATVKLPWDVASYYSVVIPERDDDEGDEEEEELNTANLQRLKNADERTKHMTKDEYVRYSEYRQASFTFRKGKRFREWAGFGIATDGKPSDDVVDILGFLTFEIVQTLTEEALKVKAEADQRKRLSGHGAKEDGGGFEGRVKKRKREMGLFEGPEEEKTTVQPEHLQEAFRRSQQPTTRYSGFKFARRGPPARRTLQFVSSPFDTALSSGLYN